MMKKLYKKIVFFLVPIFLVWLTLEFFYRFSKTNYTLKNQQIATEYKDAEILIFGNSHALYGLNPEYFTKKTFNIANISQSLYFDELLFYKHQPNLPKLKAIVLTISYFSLSHEENTSEDLWRKYFYCQQMDLEIPIISKFDIRKYSLSLARRFNNSIELVKEYAKEGTNVNCFENGFGIQDESDIVVNKKEITPLIVKKHEDNKMDFTSNVNRLQKIIKVCQENNITVFLVEMPVYKTYYQSLNIEKKNKIVSVLNTLQETTPHVFYYKFSQDSIFNDEDLRDADHLTNSGAKKCSVLLNKKIEENL